MNRRFIITIFTFFIFLNLQAQVADSSTYLNDLKQELKIKWPKNRTINLVFHGHSVPTGYYEGNLLKRMDSYPFYTLRDISAKYNYAVVNVITTSIGGEQSDGGSKRFETDVISLKPDVVFIDYGLNDRRIGLELAKKYWIEMISMTLGHGCKVILLTPTPDLKENILYSNAILAKHAEQIRFLADSLHVGLVDSYNTFKKLVEDGAVLNRYMAQNNHPNEKGHEVVTKEILKWF
jgi:lysophospholipase L1-like esterase